MNTMQGEREMVPALAHNQDDAGSIPAPAPIIDLSAYRKERQVLEDVIVGEVLCVECKHRWIAEAPTGVEWFECPQCHLMKGKFFYAIKNNTESHWACNCGNDLFYITPDRIYCPKCGETQRGY